MKKSLFFLSVFTLLIIACKKDKNNSDDNLIPQGSVNVQIILPKGSPIDISKTQIFTLGKSYKVDSKGKANIDFYGNGGQLASLFNESGQLLLESYITTASKEISIKTTSQALLFQSMQMIFLPDSAKFPFLLKTTDYPPLAEYYSQMEKAFIADPLMLENKNFKSILNQALTQVKQKNVNDIYGRFMDVITNEEKSKIEIKEVDDENINIINHYYRRAWAYIYKTEYVKKENHDVVTIWDHIPKEAEARKDTKVEKVKFIGKKIDQMGVASGDIKATTGPVNLPILDDEAEVTYKVRVVGPGKEVSNLTQTEDMKLLGTLYQEYFAYDILAPMLLENLGYRSLLPELNEDNLSSYFNKVNSLTLSNGNIITNIREGKVRDAIQLFSQVMDQNNVSVYDIYEELINGFRSTYKNIYNTSQEDKNENFEKAKKVYNLLAYLSFENADAEDFIIAPHKYFNELEEFEVKVSNNEVKLSPKEGVTSTFTDYLLVASVNVDTSGGNTIKYKWTTTGKYGVLKEVGTSHQGTNLEVINNGKVNYYANVSGLPWDSDNIEEVEVTVYKVVNGKDIELGKGKASVNVKPNRYVMQPRDAEIDMAHGDSRSVRLYLIKADGTNNIYPGGALDYKVVWETEGIYGQFENNSNNFTTQNNSVVYTAYDDENVTDGSTENITAKIYMKTKSGSSWILLDNVSGKVKLSNDSKRMIIYRSSVGIHKDLYNWCYAGCVMVIPKIKDAIKYQVYSSATGGSGASWNVTGSEPGLVAGAPGIGEEDVPAGSYLYGDYYSFTWGGPLDPNVPHRGDHYNPPACGDTYKIVITLKQ